MSALLIPAAVFLAAAALTGAMRRAAIRMRVLLDRPVSRSAHSDPVPTGGGLVIVALFLAAVAWYCLSGRLAVHYGMAFLGAALVAAIGLADDIRPLGVGRRMACHVLAAAWSLWWMGEIPPAAVGGWVIESQWLLGGLLLLSLVSLLNLYNFMDGIDGLAGGELLFVASMALLFAAAAGDRDVALPSAVLLAAGAGFLVWNWPPARIFMGDVGSGFIGLCLGIIAMISLHQGSMSVWTWVILLGVFITDSTLTLLRRVAGGEPWYQAHASHAFQHAARRYGSHRKVTMAVMAVNLLWLAPMAWLATQRQELGFWVTMAALAPLAAAAYRLGAGKPEQPGR